MKKDVHLLFWFFVIVRDGIVVTAAYLEDVDADMVEEKAQEGERVY